MHKVNYRVTSCTQSQRTRGVSARFGCNSTAATLLWDGAQRLLVLPVLGWFWLGLSWGMQRQEIGLVERPGGGGERGRDTVQNPEGGFISKMYKHQLPKPH